MSHTIEISDSAYALLKQHRKIAGQNTTELQEMNELFAISDQVWPVFNDEQKNALAIVRHAASRNG